MAINAEVMELIQILDEAEFGWLAGELLSEISLGRERGSDPNLKADYRQDSETDDEDLEDIGREPIDDEEQLAEAVRILRLRLVEPARKLAEAETIGARLADQEQLRIAFVNDNGVADEALQTRARPGDSSAADKLDEVLGRLIERPRLTEA